MTETIRRRGPDDDGYFVCRDVALGMRRLSIIDVDGGQQPITNEDGSVVVVCNGEIYNFQILRKELEAQGHEFRTHSDVEVLVHLYEEYGDDFVARLDGMFAFALYDQIGDRLLLGRDRFGIKPLFFCRTGHEFIFASELKAILAHDRVSASVDHRAIDSFFTFTHIPCPRTIYSQIKKVPPASIVTIEKNREVSERKYWHLSSGIDESHSKKEWIERCELQLRHAVRSHMISDVPLGAFLSGGIDSSLIVAMMASENSSPVDAFTVSFDGHESGLIDERPYARELTSRYGLRHHEIIVQPNFDEVAEDIISAFDEPFADDSVIPTYYICQATSCEIKVALSGLGGDELFGGYTRHLGLLLGESLNRVPSFLIRGVVRPIVESLKQPRTGGHFVDRLKRFVRAAGMQPPQRYLDSLSSLPRIERQSLYGDRQKEKVDLDFSDSTIVDREWWSKDLPLLEAALRTDLDTYLADDVLALTDRLSMWHSLEVRVPFLDHSFVEMAARVPSRLKIRGTQQKYLLREIAKRWVPKSILTHKKQGFESPMAVWLAGPLRSKMEHYLSPIRLDKQNIFNSEFVGKLVKQHRDGKQQNSKILFSLLTFQLWLEQNANDVI